MRILRVNHWKLFLRKYIGFYVFKIGMKVGKIEFMARTTIMIVFRDQILWLRIKSLKNIFPAQHALNINKLIWNLGWLCLVFDTIHNFPLIQLYLY